MPIPNFSKIHASTPRLCLTGIALFTLLGCAANKPQVASPPVTIPPPVATEATAAPATPMSAEDTQDALRMAQENRLELQTLITRVKELEGQVQTLSEQLEASPVDRLQGYEAQLDSLRHRLSLAEQRSSSQSSAPTVQAPPNPAQAAGTLPAAASVSNHAKISAPEAALYKKASNLYYGHKYAEAIPVYHELESKYPEGSYADNAVYWIGECQFALKKYDEAVASFKRVLEFKETEKADDAQIKLGYCYVRLGNRKQAAEEFRKLVSLYPDSEYLERAKSELVALETPGR